MALKAKAFAAMVSSYSAGATVAVILIETHEIQYYPGRIFSAQGAPLPNLIAWACGRAVKLSILSPGNLCVQIEKSAEQEWERSEHSNH